MLEVLTILLFSGLAGYCLAYLAGARLRLFALGSWALAPSATFLAKAAVDGMGWVFSSVPWAIVLVLTWGGAALLGYYGGRARQRSVRERG
jgi:hypothetical protein